MSRGGKSTPPPRPVASAPVAALADLPVGPTLAAAVAGLDPASVTPFERVLMLQAVARLTNHYRGLVLATVGDLMLDHDPDYGQPADLPSCGGGELPDEPGANEVRAALVMSRRGANTLCLLAGDLAVRLPQVRAAMLEGRLDQSRATIFSTWTTEVSDRHARHVVDQLLPLAPKLTPAQLVKAIQKAVVDLDPEWARRRYENALKARDVRGSIRSDGTADLTGTNLPADQVAAACDNIDALAHRIRNAGHPWLLRHIRADIFLGRHTTYNGWTEDEIFNRFMAMPRPGDGAVADPGHGGRDNGSEGADDGGPSRQPADAQSTVDDAGRGGPDPSDGTATPGAAPEPERKPDPTPPGRGRGKGLRLLAALASIAGVDERPGELLGYGHLLAPIARQIAGAPHAAWYAVLTNAGGTPLVIAALRRRPGAAVTDNPTVGASAVEAWLQLTTDELATLTSHPPHGWESVIAEVATRAADTGPPNGDPSARIPSTLLRRWINVRDRYCVYPGCGVPAHKTDADHTVEHSHDGPTTDVNLGSCCGRDHGLKTTGGWTLRQPTPGQFLWTSPLGHTYERLHPRGPEHAFAPMPEPVHPDEDRFWIQTSDTWHGPESCLQIDSPAPSPPPEPDRVTAPPPRRPVDDAIPF